MLREIFFYALIIVCVVSCSSTSSKSQPEESSATVVREFEKIKQQISREPWEKSASRLQAFIAQHPESDLADDAAMTLGQLLESQKRYNEAYNSYMKVVDARVSSPQETQAMIAATHMLVKLGRPDEALALSERALKKAKSEDGLLQDQLHEFRFQAYQQLKQDFESVKEAAWLAEQAATPDHRAKFSNTVALWIEGVNSDSILEKAQSESKLQKYRAAISFKLGVLAYEQKDLSQTRKYMQVVLDQARDTSADAALVQKANGYLQQIDMRRKVDSETIGLVVPLTGKYAKVGYKALHGVQLAMGTFSPNGKPLKLAVVDSEGNSDVARKAIERLVNEDNAIAIIGGLTSKTALQEALKSQELGVPFIALSQAQGLTDIGSYVFRNSVTSRNQMSSLVAFAMDQQKLKTFAILYPNDPYGAEFASAFFDEVTLRGGYIRGIQSYDPKETDFREPIRKLFGTYYPEDRADEYRLHLKEWQDKNPKKGAAPPEDLLPPIVDFEALFVPDSVRAVGQIAPMLFYNNVKTVKLLGTNLWNTPDLVTRGQKFVEGSLFVDTFLEGDNNLLSSRFFADFKSTFQEDPGLFEVLAYESAMILRKAMNDHDSSRVGLREALAQLRSATGVTSSLTITPGREVTRELHRLMVDGGKIISTK